MNQDLTIGLLSWKAHQTLRRTLDSYEAAGLASNAVRSFVYFNAMTDEDLAIAGEYGWEAAGGACNLGIWGGMDEIARLAQTEYILFLQNDCPVVASEQDVSKWIGGAVELLKANRVEVVQLRHRFNRGDGYKLGGFFKYHHVKDLDERYLSYRNPPLPPDAFRDSLRKRILRLLRPVDAHIRSRSYILLERHPEERDPRYFSRVGEFIVGDSELIPFSEQPFLIAKSFYERLSAWGKGHRRHRRLNGFPIMEQALNVRWWRQMHFRVAMCDEGVFTHARWDDSWRPGHLRFNATLLDAAVHQ